MKTFFYKILSKVITLISRLPFRILFFISDILFLIIYYIIGYRKKVVYDNLKLCFPNKPEKDILLIRKQFFKWFIDSIIESVKSNTISEEEIKKRYHIENKEVLENLNKEGKSILLAGSHYANWEWVITLPLFIDIPINTSYKKISNPFVEKKMKDTRMRFGMNLIESTSLVKEVTKKNKEHLKEIYVLIADQSPGWHKGKKWADFFGNKVPFFMGPESLSKRFNMAVVYISAKRLKRGFYSTKFHVITKEAKEEKPDFILNSYINHMEEQILNAPECYLWSHKRFKHLGKEEL